MSNINIWLILAVVAASNVAGFFWYSPFLFGKKWMVLMGFSEEKFKQMKSEGMAKIYIINAVLDVITANILVFIISTMDLKGLVPVFQLSIMIWLGFMVPILAASVLWENKPLGLFYINAGFRLVSVLLMGVILVLGRI